ncbi:hypothetical protein SAURM35S_05435 [Streptomyces aurantiogriseus]
MPAPRLNGSASPRSRPPSITIVSPVIQLAASETRKATAEAMSAGSPMRPSAVAADTACSWSLHRASASFVRTTPGATALTRILGESPRAGCFVRWISAAFDALYNRCSPRRPCLRPTRRHQLQRPLGRADGPHAVVDTTGPEPGLGHGEGRGHRPVEQGLEVLLLVLVAAEQREHLHVAGVGSVAVARFRGDVTAPHDLRQRRVLEVRQTGAPLRVRVEQIPQSAPPGLRLEFLDDRRVEVRARRYRVL